MGVDILYQEWLAGVIFFLPSNWPSQLRDAPYDKYVNSRNTLAINIIPFTTTPYGHLDVVVNTEIRRGLAKFVLTIFNGSAEQNTYKAEPKKLTTQDCQFENKFPVNRAPSALVFALRKKGVLNRDTQILYVHEFGKKKNAFL